MNSRMAEWILSLVLPPERAASTVGDWLEASSERGTIWFWSCVFRTLFARIWSGLTDNPVTMASIGVSGFARNFMVLAGFYGLFLLLVHGPWRPDIRYRHDWLWTTLMVNHAGKGAPPQINLRWPFELIAWLLYSARLIQTARWLSKRAPGLEMAGFVTIALTGWVSIILFLCYGPLLLTRESILMYIGHDLILCSSVVWMRRHSFR